MILLEAPDQPSLILFPEPPTLKQDSLNDEAALRAAILKPDKFLCWTGVLLNLAYGGLGVRTYSLMDRTG